MRLGIAATALLAAGLFSAAASANPLGTYGYGSRETSLAGAVTADTSTFSAVFYNPAGLAMGEKLDLSLGYFRVDQRLLIDGKDTDTDPVRGIVGGLSAPGKLFGVPFAFGVATHLPDDRLSRVRTLRQEIPRWELYHNRAQILFVGAMLAVRPVKWLSIGGGIAFLSSTRGSLGITGQASIESPYDSQLRHEVDADLTTVRIPIVGVRVEPHRRVSLGITYRGESKLDLRLTADIHGQVYVESLKTTVPVRYTLTSQSFDAFHPRQIALGGSVLITDRVRGNLDLVYTQWSAYKSATSLTTSHLDIELKGLAPPDPKPTVVRDPGFHDTIAPHLGVEITAIDGTTVKIPVRLGYAYERSPVPPQTGATNFVDSDRHTLAFGTGIRLSSLLPELPSDIRLDVHGAYMVFPERKVKKDSPADFVGDYVASGHQTNVGATLGMGF
jgi:long-subunit fatty acid transport protein